SLAAWRAARILALRISAVRILLAAASRVLDRRSAMASRIAGLPSAAASPLIGLLSGAASAALLVETLPPAACGPTTRSGPAHTAAWPPRRTRGQAMSRRNQLLFRCAAAANRSSGCRRKLAAPARSRSRIARKACKADTRSLTRRRDAQITGDRHNNHCPSNRRRDCYPINRRPSSEVGVLAPTVRSAVRRRRHDGNPAAQDSASRWITAP